MKRRAWILGGALASGAVASGKLFNLWGGSNPAKMDRFLNLKSGPLAVHEGFEVLILERAGAKMSDGSRSPEYPDGMACFEQSGKLVLMRNHELIWDKRRGAYPDGQPTEAYNPRAQGGVSRLVLHPETLRVASNNMVLTGTLRNCGGGPSPWGWISCEEAREDGHGYSFLCDAHAENLQKPQRIEGYGRFRHEAVAVDPDTSVAYLTEDEGTGCLYRFTPRDVKTPFVGRLEALRIRSAPNARTKSTSHAGRALPIEWVPIVDPEAKQRLTRHQGKELGAATFARGEGIWMDGDGVVFSATSGGQRGFGQIFRVSIKNQTLTLVAESTGAMDFLSPDNITVAPFGDMVVAEDHMGVNHIRGVTPSGEPYPIARNLISSSEFTGVCFSPNGKTLFCTLQADGLTLAITGPFEQLRSKRIS